MDEKIISEVVKAVIKNIEPKKINLEVARRLIHRIEKKADEMGVRAVVAVANEGGNIVAVECMDESYIASYDVAVNKAFTCAALKMSTSELKKLAEPGASLYGIQFTNGGRIVIFGGGTPLKVDGKTIGGLGVSGGSEQEDTLLAEYGQRVFLEEIL